MWHSKQIVQFPLHPLYLGANQNMASITRHIWFFFFIGEKKYYGRKYVCDGKVQGNVI